MDKNVEGVVEMLRSRSEVGVGKYGCTTADANLSPLQWTQHLQEELLDAAVYLQVLKQKLKLVYDR